MQLKKLGTLQDIGYEDAYLHVSEPDNTLFVEVTRNNAEKGVWRSLYISVTAHEVYEYLKSKISLKDMARHTTHCYRWSRRSDAKGVFRKVKQKDAVNYIEDDEKFDPSFCPQQQLILYYMNNLEKISTNHADN